jgi:cyclopropane-fatty-acyl-phospholipid synthase
METGSLTLELPDGQVRRFGTPGEEPSAVLRVRRWEAFRKIAWAGEIGLGESYTDGDWDADDLTALLRVLAANVDALDDRRIASSWMGRIWDRLRHRGRRNSLANSRRNIPAHYDLGDELFQEFLDPTMSYSCAMFGSADQSLEEAQRHKISRILAKLDVRETDHVLEIGSGWGSFAIEAAQQTGCRVHGVTLSPTQLQTARRRAVQAGVDELVQFELCDYRRLTGVYDKIVSIEMLEAVGHENLGEFFAVCERSLKPGGRVVLQFITIADHRYESYRRGCDWIQKHIFPGGHLLSVSALLEAARSRSKLVVEHLESMGLHYARTLECWRRRFHDRWETIASTGLDERFRRTWDYYLSYCEAAFAERHLSTVQMVLTRPGLTRTREPAVVHSLELEHVAGN